MIEFCAVGCVWWSNVENDKKDTCRCLAFFAIVARRTRKRKGPKGHHFFDFLTPRHQSITSNTNLDLEHGLDTTCQIAAAPLISAMSKPDAALIFPISWQEPFGLVMIEAMACGCPVIAFCMGSVPEIIEHGVTGFIVDTEEEAIAALQDIGTLDRKLIRQRFEERFTSTTMGQKYLDVYERVIQQAKVVQGAKEFARTMYVPKIEDGRAVPNAGAAMRERAALYHAFQRSLETSFITRPAASRQVSTYL